MKCTGKHNQIFLWDSKEWLMKYHNEKHWGKVKKYHNKDDVNYEINQEIKWMRSIGKCNEKHLIEQSICTLRPIDMSLQGNAHVIW